MPYGNMILYKHMDARESIGTALRLARKKRKLTQFKLSQAAGINANYYAQIERGEVNVSAKILQMIIEVLKVKSSDILPY